MSARDGLGLLPFSDYADPDPHGQLRIGDDDGPRCVCARHADGSVTTSLCPAHADTDPCLTMARVTGRRRTGTILRGVCTACRHGGATS